MNENGGMQGGMGVAVRDYDCDGWLDLVKTKLFGLDGEPVSQQRGRNFLRCGLAGRPGRQYPISGMGRGFCDFDNDGG